MAGLRPSATLLTVTPCPTIPTIQQKMIDNHDSILYMVYAHTLLVQRSIRCYSIY